MNQGVAHGFAISVPTIVCRCQFADDHRRLFHSTHVIPGVYVDTLGTFVNVTGKFVVSVYAHVAIISREYVPADDISHAATH